MDNYEAARRIVTSRYPDLSVHVCDSYEALPDVIAKTEAEVIYSIRFDGTPRFPRSAILESPSVKWVSVGGSGTDHLSPWDPAELVVTNSAGVAADMMAQYALGSMLSFSLGFPAFSKSQRERRWAPGKMERLDGKCVLIIGLGNTGRSVAALSKALGLEVLGIRANPQETENVDAVFGMGALQGNYGRADFIVVCVPLLDSTLGLIGPEAFSAMKSNAVLIDVSRGGVVDENALLNALDHGQIRGAALDVFSMEPLPEDHPLWAYENVILTPHCSSIYDGWEEKSVEMFCDNLSRYLAGKPLSNVVNPDRGY